jgi:DNA uptake protein ComE-like DNA-binding protein
MKKALRSYLSFSRTERVGLVCLGALIIILIIIRTTMSLWVHPVNDTEKERQLIAAWEVYKRSQPKTDSTHEKNDYQDAFDDNDAPLPAIIELNSADSATLVRLKGIGPVTAGKIVARRREKGPFTHIDQLKEVGAFAPETFEILKKHLTIR